MPRGAWWVLLGFLALPVMLLHDWLLTGDPFFWADVSQALLEGVRRRRPFERPAELLATFLATATATSPF